MSVRATARALLERLESTFDAAFTPALNPLYHLGALGWFFFWIVAASGIYIYIFFDTGIDAAYRSVEYMTHEQWYAAGVMRSLHRYASDALIAVVAAHLVREFVLDRYRGARWFSWFTGIPLLGLIYASGISGYWVVWDKLALYVALTTSEWLDTLPLFGEPIARNFIHESTLSGRFFTLMVFIHIAVPLMLLLGMWIHIQRNARSKVTPPLALAIGSGSMLLALSLVYPALSQGPAELGRVTSELGLDWFYLVLYPLLDVVDGQWLWLALVAGTGALVALPWAPPSRSPVASVDLDNCNGCGWCADDCPFSAISLVARTDGAAYAREAAVDPSACTGCGVCAGACPTATPFRRRSSPVPGIDLASRPITALRKAIVAECEGLDGSSRVLVFGCDHGAAPPPGSTASVAAVRLPCVGNLPPSFIDFVISRRLADGVMLVGCREGDCHYRLGQELTASRIAGERDPHLRSRISRERVALVWAGTDRPSRVPLAIEAFRSRLEELPPVLTPRLAPLAGADDEASRAPGAHV